MRPPRQKRRAPPAVQAEPGKPIRLGLQLFQPMLADAVGRSELDVELDGRTVGDLLGYLVRRYGRRARQALLDEQGRLDLEVQVLVNGKTWANRDKLDAPLADGDQVIIMTLLAGG
ncbi:MAG: MoaD family protein [Deltaproteobacteria bacterium]|nr:MoaD family protein [Deltaproteobacteria bacterium]